MPRRPDVSPPPSASALRARIHAVVRRIPRGKVATYGQIAALAGFPRHARQVGYAMRDLPRGSDLPWHRVLNARGEVSPRAAVGWEDVQRDLLEQEGIELARERVDLTRYGWKPRTGHARPGEASAARGKPRSTSHAAPRRTRG
ncbi:MGMT family protein [Candidatus Binatia bacterium]|nr:MGMT family protein [Candidatus Binatia bacterium]